MNKMTITWDGLKTNITLEGKEPVPLMELVGVLEYAKLILFKNEEKQED